MAQIAGYTILNSGAYQAFVRDASGNFAVFSAPNAGTRAYTGTQAFSINASGTIAGCYIDTKSVGHGFVRY